MNATEVTPTLASPRGRFLTTTNSVLFEKTWSIAPLQVLLGDYLKQSNQPIHVTSSSQSKEFRSFNNTFYSAVSCNYSYSSWFEEKSLFLVSSRNMLFAFI